MDYFCFESVSCVDKPIAVDFQKYECNIAYAIGHSLADFRKCTQKGQQEMANYFGVSVGQYRKYEAGIDIPKMHAAARWSAMTGAPLPLLFKYSGYAKFFAPAELVDRPYCSLIAQSSDKDFYMLLSLLSGQSEWLNHININDQRIEHQLALEDVLTHYYYRVMKNIEAIRQHHDLSPSDMSNVLGLSAATYAKYSKHPESISMPLTLYARAHIALSIDTNWAETGSTFYALIYKRRKDRIAIIESLMRKLDKDNAETFQNTLILFGEQYEKIQQLQTGVSASKNTI